MSIAEPHKIDLVAARPDSSVVKLVIADHLTWDDVNTHISLLQEKINTYLEFVESGHLRRLKAPKIPEVPDIYITLAAQHPPSEEGKQFLQRAEEFLAGVGIRFEVELHHVSK